jgi:hypothetical protein
MNRFDHLDTLPAAQRDQIWLQGARWPTDEMGEGYLVF